MKFYVLESPKAGDGDAVTDFLAADNSKLGNAPRCPVCDKYLGGMPLLPPICIETETWGSQWGDIGFGVGDQILISEKLKNLFLSSGLLGIEQFNPVKIIKIRNRKRGPKVPPAYYLATIQRSQTMLDEQASGLIRDEKPVCEVCRTGGITKRIKRVIVDINTWTNEDIFYARGLSGTILVSERFKCLCEDNKLTNCDLIAAEEYSFDFYPNERSNKNLH